MKKPLHIQMNLRLFIDDYMTGKLPRDIFKENVFAVDIIGMKRIEKSACHYK